MSRSPRWRRFGFPLLLLPCLMRGLLLWLLLGLPLGLWGTPTSGAEWHGYLSVEGRYFLRQPLYPTQADQDGSISSELDLRWQWREVRFAFSPFARLDSADSERTHFDIRELQGEIATGPWDWQVGIGKVFWGVAESLHLIDIINQTDQVEGLDGGAGRGAGGSGPIWRGWWVKNASLPTSPSRRPCRYS